MKTIAGTILIVAAAIFYHARTDLAGRKIGYDERNEMIRTCQVASVLSGIAGVFLIGVGVLPVRRKLNEEEEEKLP